MALSLRRKLGGGSSGSRAGAAGFEVVITQDDLRDLVRAINRHGEAKPLRAELRKGLREAAKPIVPKARAAVRGQSGGKRSTGLRADVARALEVKVDLGLRSDRIGVRVRLDGKKMRTHPASLAAAFEGAKPWRHPVFGDRGTWVAQEPRGFLKEVVDAERPRVLREMQQTMDNVWRKINKGV